jgi:phage shock protein A
MTTPVEGAQSPHERERRIADERNAAGARSAGLRARIAELASAAKSAVRAGRFADAQQAATEKASLEPELRAAEHLDAVLGEVADEVSLERQRADWSAELEQVRTARDAAERECHVAVAALDDAISVLRQSVASAKSAQGALNNARQRHYVLQSALEGRTEHSRFGVQGPQPVTSYLEHGPAARLLAELRYLPRQ